MQPSGSELSSAAFERLHPGVQRWLWNQGWPGLRPIQEQTAQAILGQVGDVIVAAPTASGKTEAAWLPICSLLAWTADGGTAGGDTATGVSAGVGITGVQALYIAPLKALINDQHSRLDDLCRALDLPVHRWHGDVPASQKTSVVNHPSGLLLITPESLEAMFVNRGTGIAALLGRVSHVVIDELHSFIGSERGAQLQSLLHRVELALRRRIPRIALSATLGDFGVACEFLRPGDPTRVSVVVDPAGDGSELKMQLRGYVDGTEDADDFGVYDQDGPAENAKTDSADALIADHLYRVLRGHDNLVFANSRRKVEQLTDRLRRRCEIERVPNEFVAHHGNLSREMREDAESRLKEHSRPTTAICTSTLEMGIDIGSVDAIGQVGAPVTVSSLRQRLGRSGRRPGQAAVLRAYISESKLDSRSDLTDQLRTELIQTIAMIDLLLLGWYESPNGAALHLSTLIQQILSVIAQHGGASAAQAYSALCGHGPFRSVDADMFTELLRSMGDADLLVQEPSGLLLHGVAGERLVNHYSFYAAFASAEEYRLIADGRPIGTLPVDRLLQEGSALIFGGRRWRVLNIDTSRKVITLTYARGGRAPHFTSAAPTIADRVRQRMRQILIGTDVPAYLDPPARDLLAQARSGFGELRLNQHLVYGNRTETRILPWRGDSIMTTLALAFTWHGLTATADGISLTVAADPATVLTAAAHLAQQSPPDARELAALVRSKERDKHDRYLTDSLLTASYAAAALDVPGTWEALTEIAGSKAPVLLDGPTADLFAVDEAPISELAKCAFAVIDVETTGLAVNHGDRIIEISIVEVDVQGRLGRVWTTLLNPDRDPGPTHIHGLLPADLSHAPHFADIVGDIAQRIQGRIIVAHNALFDLTFLHAEFSRTNTSLPPWPTLCTLDASYVLRPRGPRTLAACAQNEGIIFPDAHTAEGDAVTTARLLGRYLADARSAGLGLDAIGVSPRVLPPAWRAPAPSGAVHLRSRVRAVNTGTGLAVRLHNARRGTPADDAYLDALDRALASGPLYDDAAAHLHELALMYGLDTERTAALNRLYADELAATVQDVDRPPLMHMAPYPQPAIDMTLDRKLNRPSAR